MRPQVTISVVVVMGATLVIGRQWMSSHTPDVASVAPANKYQSTQDLSLISEAMADRVTELELGLSSVRKSVDEVRETVASLVQETATISAQYQMLTETNGVWSTDTSLVEGHDEVLIEEHLEEIKTNAMSEAIDSEWSTQAEIDIRTTMKMRHLVGIEDSDVQCRSTLCEISLTFNDYENRDKALQLLPLLVPWETEAMLEVPEEDNLSVVLYATRKGNSL